MDEDETEVVMAEPEAGSGVGVAVVTSTDEKAHRVNRDGMGDRTYQVDVDGDQMGQIKQKCVAYGRTYRIMHCVTLTE